MPITCPNHPEVEAVVGVMVYGPEGGTTDLCGDCLATWALSIAEGAYGPLAPDPTRSPQTAQEAADPPAGTGGRRGRRSRQHDAPAVPEDQESPAPEGAQVEGAEHGRGDSSVEPGETVT